MNFVPLLMPPKTYRPPSIILTRLYICLLNLTSVISTIQGGYANLGSVPFHLWAINTSRQKYQSTTVGKDTSIFFIINHFLGRLKMKQDLNKIQTMTNSGVCDRGIYQSSQIERIPTCVAFVSLAHTSCYIYISGACGQVLHS